ncbi:MAG: hypothetical protein FJZ96_01710 [Chloroflexi bacterium]|nr:hypothetical protein [Chloroflexota bacterium]
MANIAKASFLQTLRHKAGEYEKFGDSLSLFKIKGTDIRIYIRYSRTHDRQRTWYGLRKSDLDLLQGYPSVICFLWDNQEEPLIIPYSDFEEVFDSIQPADDGQIKAQVLLREDATELYIARVGRFNVEGYIGWLQIKKLIEASGKLIPALSHTQVQTLLGSIGAKKEFDIWIPPIDRPKLDWKLTLPFSLRDVLPFGSELVADIMGEIDVIWLKRGSNEISAFFEVEHSTPIYSGLLRFNDVHLAMPRLNSRFSIVANSERRSLFARQLNRPTFRLSGLGEVCNFLEYADVYNWHERTIRR